MIGITMGDANGVGPEILLRAYRENRLSGEFVAVGDCAVLNLCNERLSLGARIGKMSDIHDYVTGRLNVYDLRLLDPKDVSAGRVSRKVGQAALAYVKEGTLLTLKGFFKALVTLPVHKGAIRLSDKRFTGHTGFIASLCGTASHAMMLASDELLVTHVSTHVSLRRAVRQVKKDRIYDVIVLTHEAVRKLRPRARIAVAGLNPHAGEEGAFGSEEIEEIAPAVRKARKKGMEVSGPEPPDTVFHQAVKGRYDAVVCMYHDQGHIPLKLLNFEEGVNVTLGLPMVRTSVDHGTAYDIAYRGIASTQSFVNAYALAVKLLK